MFDLHNERCEAKKGDLLFVCVLVQREGEREEERETERKRRKERGQNIYWVLRKWFGVV